MRARLLSLGLLTAALLAGCGQKGPLYLPPPLHPPHPAAQSAPLPHSTAVPQATTLPQPATLPQPRSSLTLVPPAR